MRRRDFLSSAMALGTAGLAGTANAAIGPQRLMRAEAPSGAIPVIPRQIGGRSLEQVRNELHQYLFGTWIPFWNKGGIDKEYGGFLCNLDEDGKPVDEEKYIWYQGRGAWVFAWLYNEFGKRPEFLEVAEKSRDFMTAHMQVPGQPGHWVARVSRDGKTVILGDTGEIYNWLFPAEGLIEIWKATGRQQDLDLALVSIKAAVEAYEKPDYNYPTLVKPGIRPQGHSMVFLRVLQQLLPHYSEPWLEALCEEHRRRITEYFYNPEFGINNEYLAHDWTRLPEYADKSYLGHSLEIQWMVMQDGLRIRDRAVVEEAAKNIWRYLLMGWDYPFDAWSTGDYRVFADETGPIGPDQNLRTMWANVEVMVAMSMILENTGDPWAGDHLVKGWDYTRTAFDTPSHIWGQAANRENKLIIRPDTPALRRDNYHPPRGVGLCIQALDRIIANDYLVRTV